MTKLRVAAIQLNTTADVKANNAQIEDMVRQAAGEGATFVSLPEAANILLRDNLRYPSVCLPEDEDTTLALCRNLAAELGIWIHAGSLLVRHENGQRVWNRAYLIAPSGDVAATYDKLHTFDVKLGGEADFQESAAVAPGESGAVVVDLGDFRLGLSICYDIRFSYLFDALAVAGANVMMIPASFSTATGPLHWEPLLKARAIETGSYVIAAAQCGERDGVWVHGQSRIISPFGEVIAAAGEDPCVITAEIDSALIETTRHRLPVLLQRRDLGSPRIVPAKL
ncbi:carbon-nitrogen hydrolase family protein [Nitratireductor pacificus]|uniref:Nitrilase/cyanide hydratase and apolipoprotein N-acyltransferase n=1 Tax=Nitratireductor pacificus pht-3B TaxID=391937 RepID=K2LRV6_9HYPH|nr:carbon-nitrogen hydrolase family protein [Nitratireductor pacificus]EKF20524.1 nitrilase/cyanide hydratase and apolipoprotein N-acyltransferase [Nitratireductor pacificus pht-3B]